VSRVLLLQLDGKLPNVALMRVAAHHRALGNEVELRQAGNEGALGMDLWDAPPDLVYASLIFERTRPLAERLLVLRPDAMVGGTGWDVSSSLEAVGITTTLQDYSVYPNYTASIGFTQRGCRLRCGFCVVPKKEGANKGELLDNDFFGQPGWRERVAEIVDGGFRVSFTQGINARLLDDDSARAIASMQYYDDSFKARRIYTAWDNRKDEGRLFAGLEALKRHGVKPDHVMVYMLIGYCSRATATSWASSAGQWARTTSGSHGPTGSPQTTTPGAWGVRREPSHPTPLDRRPPRGHPVQRPARTPVVRPRLHPGHAP
jgi:hypothetical protein